MKKLPRRLRDFISVYPTVHIEANVYSLESGMYTGQIAVIATPPQKISKNGEIALGTIYAYRVEVHPPLEQNLAHLRNNYVRRPYFNHRHFRKLHNLALKNVGNVELYSGLELLVNKQGRWTHAQDKKSFYPIVVDLVLIYEECRSMGIQKTIYYDITSRK